MCLDVAYPFWLPHSPWLPRIAQRFNHFKVVVRFGQVDADRQPENNNKQSCFSYCVHYRVLFSNAITQSLYP